MKKIAVKLSDEEYEIIKSCFNKKTKFDYLFHPENTLRQKDEVELFIPVGRLDQFMVGLVDALRAKGTINSIYTDFGRKVYSILDRLTTEFYG